MPDNDVQAHLADGTTLHFPMGTDPSVVSMAAKNHIAGSQTQMPKLSVAPINTDIVQGMPPSKFEGDVATGMGFDAQKIASRRPGLHQWAEMGGEAAKGAGDWMTKLLKDPFHIADPIEGMASGLESAAKSKSPGQMVGAAANVGMGMEAANPEKPGLSTAELKTGVADATYKRGLGVAENLKSASKRIDDSVGQSAQSFVSKVDEKFPNGAIDPKPIMESVNQVKADVVKTPERYPTGLAQMLEPEAKQSTGPRLMGNHMDLSDPSQLAAFQKLKAQGAFTPAEIARMEGTAQTGMWTAEEAKQWRTKIGGALAKTQGPMKVVLTDAYKNLTDQLRKAADDSDALKDFTDYNNLHKKHMSFLNDSVVSKIMDGETSKETLGPLADTEKMAHLQNLLDDWDKYGVKTEDLAKEGEDYGKAKALMEKKRFRWFPGGTLGGAVGAHLLGLPWGVGAGAGLAIDRMMSGAGKASKFIESSKVSPFFKSGEARAADISRGWSEGVPEISPSKVTLKKASGK